MVLVYIVMTMLSKKCLILTEFVFPALVLTEIIITLAFPGVVTKFNGKVVKTLINVAISRANLLWGAGIA